MGRRGARGFSYLELVFVIAIISVLLAVAIGKLWALQADAERVAMEQVAGALRSAIGIKVAEHIVKNDLAGLRSLEGSNPMERLSETPANYLGDLDEAAAEIEAGNWYFDTASRYLVYRVRNVERFRSDLGPPARARFAIELVRDPATGAIAGARLAAVESYRWVAD